MIAILNISPKGTEKATYQIQINNELVATFKHGRTDGLAECLRMASIAVERKREEDVIRIWEELR